QRADFELDIQPCRLGDVDREAGLDGALETRLGDFDPVGSGWKQRRVVAAVRLRRQPARLAGGLIRQHDRGGGHHGARAIGDNSGDCARRRRLRHGRHADSHQGYQRPTGPTKNLLHDKRLLSRLWITEVYSTGCCTKSRTAIYVALRVALRAGTVVWFARWKLPMNKPKSARKPVTPVNGNGSKPASTALETRLTEAQSRLGPHRQQLIGAILANCEESCFLSSRELAKRYQVDAATVVRTVQALGYRGFADFSLDLRQHLMARITPYTVLKVATRKRRSVEDHIEHSLEKGLENLNALRLNLNRDHVVDLARQ